MNKFVLLVLTALISVSSLAQAEESCKDKLARDRQSLSDVEKKFRQGKATRLEVVDAQLALTETSMDCGLMVKYNYCKYRQNLLASKIRLMTDQAAVGEIVVTDIDDVKKELADTVTYCLDPNATR